MKKLIRLIAITVTVALFLPSCTKDPESPTYKHVDTNLQVSTAVINLGANEVAPKTLTVTASEGCPFWISNKPGWVTTKLDPGTENTAKSNSALSISVTPNDELRAREGTIVISTAVAGGKIEVVAEIPVKQAAAALGFVETGWGFDKNPFVMDYTTDEDSVVLNLTSPTDTIPFMSKLRIIKKDDDGKDQEVDDDRFELVTSGGKATASGSYLFYTEKGWTTKSSMIKLEPAAENLGEEPIRTTLIVQKNPKDPDDPNAPKEPKLVLSKLEVVQNPMPLGGIAGWTIPNSITWTGTDADSTKNAINIVAPSNQKITFKLVDADKKFGIATELPPLYDSSTGKELIAKGELPVTTTGTTLELWNLTEQPENAVEAYLLIFNEKNKAVGKVKLTIAKKP